MTTRVFFFAWVVVVALLTGCYNPITGKKYKEDDELKLFKGGMKSAASSSFLSATRDFETLQTEFPYSKLSDHTFDMLIYSKLRSEKFEEVAALADVYIRIHPGSSRGDYYLYLKALSSYYQIRNYKTGSGHVVDFVDTYSVMESDYPNSPRTQYLAPVNDYILKARYLSQLDVALVYDDLQMCIASVKQYLELLGIPGFEEYRSKISERVGRCLYSIGDVEMSKEFGYDPKSESHSGFAASSKSRPVKKRSWKARKRGEV